MLERLEMKEWKALLPLCDQGSLWRRSWFHTVMCKVTLFHWQLSANSFSKSSSILECQLIILLFHATAQHGIMEGQLMRVESLQITRTISLSTAILHRTMSNSSKKCIYVLIYIYGCIYIVCCLNYIIVSCILSSRRKQALALSKGNRWEYQVCKVPILFSFVATRQNTKFSIYYGTWS